ncbi:hypothetical protein KX928_18440 [Roseobacter sp. YSTF-M11]|uniref:PEP-CTERM protein-sorting domain-containing protein n=1 Tax=Roseobacter insulae TaxID=2859783 RepID=A0A9X1JZU5_9RHOB|nr:hypothetical protein [Roseobacter insulae]MBW4709771.1 hypothetical protein [Roseobacter insulae]
MRIFPKSLLFTVFVSLTAAPAIAATVPAITASPTMKQHTNRAIGDSVGDSEGKYRTDASLFIQSEHAVKTHPYENPDDGFHHHVPEPTPFLFTQNYFVDTAADGSAIVAGLPDFQTTDPYGNKYNLNFDVEGNTRFVLDKNHSWSGSYQVPKVGGGGINSFGFGLTILGTGGQFSIGWDNDVSPDFTMSFAGDPNNPVFQFIYPDGFSMAKGTLQIQGFVRNVTSPEWGRVKTNAFATVVEDTSIFTSGPEFQYLLRPGVYDVTHHVVPLPAGFPILLTGLGVLLGVGRIRSSRVQ